MDLSVVGAVLSSVGILLSAWAIWFARQQRKLVSTIERNELVSLWAQLDRIRTLIIQVESITDDQGFLESQTLTFKQQQVLPGVHRGLIEAYVRLVELVVKKHPDLSVSDIDRWKRMGRIKTDWQRQQFLNLVTGEEQEEGMEKGGSSLREHLE